MPPILLRPPTFSAALTPIEFKTPSISWLTETWHVTHSTLPMWKSKRNVQIKYTPLPPSSPSIARDDTDRLDDLVTYQSLDSAKVSTIEGIDKATKQESGRGEWDWRGKGWLKIASSHWEILGWGEEAETGNKWAVTMFAKTLFTPAGVDVYSQSASGLQATTLKDIKDALADIDDQDVKKLAGELFEVRIDNARSS